MKTQKNVTILKMVLLFLLSSLTILASQNANLFPGEKMRRGGGFPSLTKFIKGNPEEALVVFVPGAGHTARISYGGHEGSNAEDFLAHWIVSQGYNFLGVSYPLETKNSLYEKSYPNFTVRDWGKMTAEIAKQIIDENNLVNRVIILGWSMGGKISQSISEAATNLGVNVDFYTSFSATPPITGAITMNKKLNMVSNGYADRSGSFPKWYKQIESNSSNNENRIIIPEKTYLNDYVGNFTANIQGYGLRYKDKKIVKDNWADIEDQKSYDYAKFPLVATLVSNNKADSRHALVDQGSWGMFVVNKIYHDYIKNNKQALSKLSEAEWRSLVNTVRSAPQELSVEINGNHFFFVGETGAREASLAVKNLENKVHALKNELSNLLGTTIK